MSVYDYVAIGADGKRQTGIITADSPRAARKELRLRQLSPLEVNEAKEKSKTNAFQRGGSISSSDLVLVTRQLAMLIQAGSTIEEAIGAIANEAERPATRRVLLGIRGRVQEGYSFAQALQQSGRSFPSYYQAVVAAGQTSGRLGDVMERLATHLEKSRKLQRKLLSALIYPAVLATVALVVVALLMIFVVPAVVEQFDTVGADLPALTDAVIAISNFMRSWGMLALAGLAALIWSMRRVFALPNVRLALDKFVFRLPIFGKLMRTANATRFARTFATLSGSGATVPDALIAAHGSVGSEVFRRAIVQIRRQVEEGATLNSAMRSANVFPPMLTHMVASGERGSDLSAMMGRAADYMEEELDSNATVALGLVEPLLIVLLAGVVALIVLAIMLPILQLNTLAIGA